MSYTTSTENRCFTDHFPLRLTSIKIHQIFQGQFSFFTTTSVSLLYHLNIFNPALGIVGNIAKERPKMTFYILCPGLIKTPFSLQIVIDRLHHVVLPCRSK